MTVLPPAAGWARTAQAGTTTCSGDSGAGLFVGSTVVGTISGGSGSCGSRMGASLAVRTADWITWIKKYSS
jgi:secreted trypsin-like serine protease